MGDINTSSKLHELERHNYDLQVISRRYGFLSDWQDKSISDACVAVGLNPGLFIDLLGAHKDTDLFPPDRLRSYSVPNLIDFLQKAHQFYVYRGIPGIEKDIYVLALRPANLEGLEEANALFCAFKEHLIRHMKDEDLRLFPYILYLYNIGYNEFNAHELHEMMESCTITDFVSDHNHLDQELEEMARVLRTITPGDKNGSRLLIELIQDIENLLRDLTIHRLIEDKVLGPMAREMEEKVRSEIY